MATKPVNSVPLLPVDTENQSLCPNQQSKDSKDMNACILNAAQQLVEGYQLFFIHPTAQN